MSWLEKVDWSPLAHEKAPQPLALRYRALKVHPALPGLLLKDVTSAADLKQNCQGYIVVRRSSGAILFGHIGDLARASYERSVLQSPRTLFHSGTTGDNTSVVVYNSGDATYPPGTPPQFGTLMGSTDTQVVAHPLMPLGDFQNLNQAGHLASNRRYNAMKTGPVGLYTAAFDEEAGKYSAFKIYGIITQAETGAIMFGDAGIGYNPPVGLATSNCVEVPSMPLKLPVCVGYQSTLLPVGILRDVVRDKAGVFIDNAPDDIKKFMRQAVSQYLLSPHAGKKAYVTFTTGFYMSGHQGNWLARSGLATPSGYVVKARSSNTDSEPLRTRGAVRGSPVSPDFFAPVYVEEVGDTSTDGLFNSLATGHRLGASIDVRSDIFIPVEVGGSSLSAAMQAIGDIIASASFLTQGQVTSTRVNVIGGAEGATADVGSLGGVSGSSQMLSRSFNDSPQGHPLFLDFEEAALRIYKLAEKAVKDSA